MFYFSRFKLWLFNEEEKNLFLREYIIKKDELKYFSLIQCPHQEIFFNGFKDIVENEPRSDFGGICPRLGYPSFFMWLFFLPNLTYKIHMFMIRKKWIKIYGKLDIKSFFHSNQLSYFIKTVNFWKAFMVFIKLKSKKKLLEHRFNDIFCGDLIYDTYIRFNKKPTVNLLDPTLILYIQDCYNQICYFENLTVKLKIKNYYTSYSTYIDHGIPVRVFLKNDINVYSIAYSHEKNFNFKIKKLNKDDTTQVKPHWKYKEIFKHFNNKNELRKLGLENFKKRFSGKNDLDFMKVNQYDLSYLSPKFDKDFDGVVFIGDFFDSQHIYRKMVFNDLYEWLIFTIELVLEYNLNVGFKTHPNQLLGSKIIIDKIKIKYPNINWIDAETSNKLIFNSGITYGISVWGSVIPELAFHKIIPICCSDNPASPYEFKFEAKTIKQYKDIVLNPKKFKFKKNLMQELGEYYYMQNIYEGFDSII